MDKNMTLEKRIDAELYSYQGRMSVFVDDLQGHTVERGADEEFETASVIKAFLLAALYLQAERGKADLSAEIEYEASQFVDGSGMLRALGVGARLKVKDTATMMIICSDNIATNMLIDYLGADDNEYVRAVTRKTLCAAIKRVLYPGCKFDSMLVLNGPQGVGKSTLIAKLAGEWFSDSLNLGDTKDKTAAEKLQGYWILEIGELAGLRKAEVETLRSFLSRQNDIYRAAFGRRATPHPRQCIFFGTTNAESGYLRDTTGNRRFWPVKTPGGGAKHSWELTQEDIGQIWAEVLVFVENGEKLHLAPDLETLAKSEQREALESDEREGLVREYLETLLPEDWDGMDLFDRRSFLAGVNNIGRAGTVARTRVCNMEIWCELFGKDQGSLGRAESNNLTAMLTKLGWVRKEKKERVKPYGPQFVFVPGDVPD